MTTPIGLRCVVLIGGFFSLFPLLHEVPADPPMGLSEYRLDQASQRSRGPLSLMQQRLGTHSSSSGSDLPQAKFPKGKEVLCINRYVAADHTSSPFH